MLPAEASPHRRPQVKGKPGGQDLNAGDISFGRHRTDKHCGGWGTERPSPYHMKHAE